MINDNKLGEQNSHDKLRKDYSYLNTTGNVYDINDVSKEFNEVKACKNLFSEGENYVNEIKAY